MVIAHAVVAAEGGGSVTTVLIDDGPGARLATREVARLQRLQAQGHDYGSIRLANTITILAKAAGGEHLPDKTAMRATYDRLRACDDGLPPIASTPLLSGRTWEPT